MNAKKIVEATLFSSSKPLSLIQLGKLTGLKTATVEEKIILLNKEYLERESALEILSINDTYYLQLRKEVLKYSEKTGTSCIPRKLIRTLSLIAYHQPVMQSMIKDMIGQSSYDHVKELVSLRIVHKKKSGNSYILSTTSKFIEVFGFDPRDREAIKSWIMENVSSADSD